MPHPRCIDSNTTALLIGLSLLTALAPTISYAADSDGDGIDDARDNCTDFFNPQQRDSDGDLYGDVCDGDLNNDGVVSTLDYGLLLAAVGTSDASADFVRDGTVSQLDAAYFVDTLFGTPLGPSGRASAPDGAMPDVFLDDSDGDGLPSLELAFRRSGVADATDPSNIDRCPGFPSTDNTDSDGDGIADPCDLCVDLDDSATPGVDTDGDGIGNACDADYNNDGVVSVADWGVFYPCFVGTASGEDCAVADANGDGYVSTADFANFYSQFTAGVPGDSGLACADATASSPVCPAYGALYETLDDWMGQLTHVENTLYLLGVRGLTTLEGLENLHTVGTLWIERSPDLVSLTGIEGLTSVSEGIYVAQNDALEDIHGLSGFTGAADTAFISLTRNPRLVDISALSGLTDIAQLSLWRLPLLTSLDALENLRSVNDLSIGHNLLLEDLHGLSGLTGALNVLRVSNNPILPDLVGLEGIESVSWIQILDQDAMTSIDGLDGLESIRRIDLWRNAALKDVTALSGVTGTAEVSMTSSPIASLEGLGGITTFERLEVLNCDSLTTLDGLDAATTIGRLEVIWNDALETLGSLPSLTSVDGLTIRRNPLLTDIDGMAGVSGYVERVLVEHNDSLLDLDGLSGLTSAAQLRVTDNPLVADYSGLSGVTEVSGNLVLARQDLVTTLSDLSAVTSVGDWLAILGHPGLCETDVQDFIDGISYGRASNEDNTGVCP